MLRSLILALFLSTSLAHAQSVTDVTADDAFENFAVTLFTNGTANSFDIYEEAGSGSDSSSPHNIYIPFSSAGSGTDNTNFSFFLERANLPSISGGVPENNINLRFTLDIDVNGTSTWLTTAISDSATGTFYVIDSVDIAADTIRTQDLSFADICADSNINFSCSDLGKTISPTQQDSVVVFFYLDTSNLANGTSIDPGSFTGQYYQINMSNRIFNSNFISLIELKKGDEQLRANYSLFNFTSGTARSLFVHRQVGTANTLCDSVVNSSNSTRTIGSVGVGYGSTDFIDLETTELTGLAPIKSLENDRCYNVQLFWCDRYGFCAFGSEEIQNSPEDIEALLEQQACFFFTAGFGERHYVVDYFQAFRDNILMKTSLGRAFVKWYYTFAPQHTPYILERPWLQKIIRGVAYGLYGFLKGFWILAVFGLALAGVYQSRKYLKKY